MKSAIIEVHCIKFGQLRIIRIQNSISFYTNYQILIARFNMNKRNSLYRFIVLVYYFKKILIPLR